MSKPSKSQETSALIEFRVANHRSIREEQAFSLEAAIEDGDVRLRRVAGHEESILPVVAFYGANASGKSNFLRALAFMRSAVLDSQRTWSPVDGVPRDPYAWGDARTQPSLFEATLVADGIEYQYGFVVDDKRVLEEWIVATQDGRKAELLTRDRQTLTFGANLAGANDVIGQVLRSNSLFLSTAAQLGHQSLLPLYRWFRELAISTEAIPVNPVRFLRILPDDMQQQLPLLLEQEEEIDDLEGLLGDSESVVRRLLLAADVGIQDFQFEEERVERRRRSYRVRRVLVRHHSDAEDSWLPLEEESHGTLKLLELALPVAKALQNGGVIAIDELEASLHPSLCATLVEIFQRPETNAHGAQLIFTTHDTNLLGRMNEDLPLRRDQVWMTEKNAKGVTEIHSIADYIERGEEDLERGYLQGRYGGVPYLRDLIKIFETRDE